MSLPQIPISVENAPLEQQVLYPGDWWNNFDDTYSNRQLELWYAHQLGTADRVVISDDDCDGLTSVAVLKAAYPDEEILHIASGHGSNGLEPHDAVELVRTTLNQVGVDPETGEFDADVVETGAYESAERAGDVT